MASPSWSVASPAVGRPRLDFGISSSCDSFLFRLSRVASPRLQMSEEPRRRQTRDFLQSARFLEQVRRTRHHREFLFAPQLLARLFVEMQDHLVSFAHDEQRGRLHPRQSVARQVGPASARNHRVNLSYATALEDAAPHLVKKRLRLHAPHAFPSAPGRGFDGWPGDGQATSHVSSRLLHVAIESALLIGFWIGEWNNARCVCGERQADLGHAPIWSWSCRSCACFPAHPLTQHLSTKSGQDHFQTCQRLRVHLDAVEIGAGGGGIGAGDALGVIAHAIAVEILVWD